MKTRSSFLLAILCFAPCFAHAEVELKPLMLIPDKVLFQDDFNTPRGVIKPSKKDSQEPWQSNQGTRWEVTDGVLRGRASTPEFQASHDTHKGVHPRIVLTKTPENFVLQFSMRLVDGKPFVAGQRKSVSPFIEIGHHVVRITWGAHGAMLLAEGESLQLANAQDFKLEPGKWYTVMVERRDDEVLVQFAGGPTFHGKHPSYKSDRHTTMLGGLEAGTMEVDNVTVSSVKQGDQPSWSDTLAKLPPVQDIRIKEAKPATKPAK